MSQADAWIFLSITAGILVSVLVIIFCAISKGSNKRKGHVVRTGPPPPRPMHSGPPRHMFAGPPPRLQRPPPIVAHPPMPVGPPPIQPVPPPMYPPPQSSPSAPSPPPAFVIYSRVAHGRLLTGTPGFRFWPVYDPRFSVPVFDLPPVFG
uniref:Uncharacterized protein n=1 Tax=Meloidogyne enterolobii TaxID=390850 RepID=A0A6V7UUS0_MELEN|nr:unnamed protein product [Meloidogyne enterolobii]